MDSKENPGAEAPATGAGDDPFIESTSCSTSHRQTLQKRPRLYDYQADLVTAVETKIAAGPCRPIIQLPTGAGKTVIASELISRAAARGDRVLFLVHRRELTKQSSLKLFRFGIDHGIVQAGFPERPSERVQVASIPTLYLRAIASRSRAMPPAYLVIVDEAHHARARTWNRIIDCYPSASIIGLTATPARRDGKGLGNIFQEILEPVSVRDLTPKYLVPTIYYAPVRPDLRGVHIARGDYVEAEVAERMNTPRLVGDIVEHIHKIGAGRRTVVFAVNVAHSVFIRDELRRSGTPCRAYRRHDTARRAGSDPRRARKRLYRRRDELSGVDRRMGLPGGQPHCTGAPNEGSGAVPPNDRARLAAVTGDGKGKSSRS